MTTKGQSPKRSRDLAARIIAGIIRQDLPEGADLGTEGDLLQRFGVSRGTLREALRLLEWQSIVRMERGVAGGLRVAMPSSYVPMVMFKVHFEHASVLPANIRQAFRTIQCAASHLDGPGANPLLTLLRRATDGQFVAALAEAEKWGWQAKLNERVAYRLTLEIEDRALQPGDFLGSEADLLERTKAGRGVLREALNLMEVNEVIELRRGPGGGAFVNRPTGEFAIYVTCVYLARAVAKADIAQAQASLLRACGHRPNDGDSAATDTARLHALARDAAASQANPVLRLFIRILERYWRDFADRNLFQDG